MPHGRRWATLGGNIVAMDRPHASSVAPRCGWPLGPAILIAAASLGCKDPKPPADAAADGPPGKLALRLVPITLEGGAPLAITEIAFIPGTSEFLALNKTRTVTHYLLDSEQDRAMRLGAFDVPMVDETADCGLLSVAFDPAFAENRLVYFAACESIGYSRITRHELDPADYGKIATTAATVIRVGTEVPTEAWHNVGSIGFDHDGYLWALFGDKTLAEEAQDLSTNLGSVIRIDPARTGEGYTPAPGNPFAGMAGHSPDIAAYGLRSPWRGALDHAGRLWIGDVGNSAFEEVNVTKFAGENFGASLAEGRCTEGCDQLTDPIVLWDRSNDSRYAREDPEVVPTARRVVWVGVEYPRTVAVDRYQGRFFHKMLVGDFCTGWIRAIGLDDQGVVTYDEAAGHLVGATSWALGPDGYVYASSYGHCLAWPYREGAVYRAVLADG